MNKKNLLIASVALNIGLVILIFMVKGNATKQAQEHVKKALEKSSYQVAQVKDIVDNNNLLWTLIDSTWKSPDKSQAFVKRLADAQRLPRCKGKPCSGDDARLSTSISSNDKDRSITVGWNKYYFKVIYDNKNKFVTIDAADLLGKSLPDGSEEYAGEEEAGE